jgi:hypothetical protein
LKGFKLLNLIPEFGRLFETFLFHRQAELLLELIKLGPDFPMLISGPRTLSLMNRGPLNPFDERQKDFPKRLVAFLTAETPAF